MGTIHMPDEAVPIYLQRVPGEGGASIWKISNATVAEIPELWEEYGYGPWTRKLVEILPDLPPVLDLENWQIVYILLILLVSWPIALLIAWILRNVATRINSTYPLAWIKLFGWPTKVFIFFYVVRMSLTEISLPLRARVVFEHGIGMYAAWACLLIGAIDFFVAFQARKLRMANREHAIPLIRPFGLIAKCLVIIVLLLMWAENAGYDMTTVIAGLGVGSVAIALAAKNTVENLIGAITIYIARPISPGDFCRFGTVLGTVEEVGLRATLIRTRDQSLVYIPNAIFAADEVENYSARERFRYFREFHIRLDTSADQVRYVLVELRRLFQAHPRVYEDTVSIRFDEVTEDAINLRTDAQIMTTDFQEYLAIVEDLNLQILDTLGSSGTWFSMPTRTVRTESADDQDRDRAEEIQKLVSEWTREDRLMFPDYSQED
jgi:MscS family membrane protein